MAELKIGLALGAGGARGWAHIGVLRALNELEISPDIICGTSIGAAVGAAYLTNQLDELQSWAQGMGLLGMLGIIDVTFRRGGLVASERVFERFRNAHTDILIEDLPKSYGAVATDLSTGREIWLREGPMLDAVCASTAMPGIFPAVRAGKHWLVDGALVNPVPVSLCRALGADVVIAVNLNNELSAPSRPVMAEAGVATSSTFEQLTQRVSTWMGRRPSISTRFLADQIEATANESAPNVLEILAGSIDIMQDRITRSRLAGEPPDVLVTPRLGHIGILEFDRAAEGIAIGYAAASIMRPQIELALRCV